MNYEIILLLFGATYVVGIIAYLYIKDSIKILERGLKTKTEHVEFSFLKERVASLRRENWALHKHLEIEPVNIDPETIFVKKAK